MTKLIVCTPRSLSSEAVASLAAKVAEFVGIDAGNVLVLTDGTTVCAVPGGDAAAPASKSSTSHKKTGEDK